MSKEGRQLVVRPFEALLVLPALKAARNIRSVLGLTPD